MRPKAFKKPSRKPIALVIGATTKWQADGPNTRLLHGDAVSDSEVPLSARWGAGGAIAQKFAQEGCRVIMTTRHAANAKGLSQALEAQGAEGMIVELDLMSATSISTAFEQIRREAGEPDIVIYNVGYLEGRALPPEHELLEFFPTEMFETALQLACRAPFLVAKEVLPAMRARGSGSFFFSNNPQSLRGRKRHTGESLYYPRVMMRALAQALTEEYSAHGIHIANVIVDGGIDAPGMRGHPNVRPEFLIDPAKIADAFYYLHTQHPSCWSHEIQLTPMARTPSH